MLQNYLRALLSRFYSKKKPSEVVALHRANREYSRRTFTTSGTMVAPCSGVAYAYASKGSQTSTDYLRLICNGINHQHVSGQTGYSIELEQEIHKGDTISVTHDTQEVTVVIYQFDGTLIGGGQFNP